MQARGLKGKVVVVTGGGQGIGPGTALRMAAEGGLVMVADLNEKRDQDLLQAIAAAAGQGSFVQVNLANRQQARQLFEDVRRRFDKLREKCLLAKNFSGWSPRYGQTQTNSNAPIAP